MSVNLLAVSALVTAAAPTAVHYLFEGMGTKLFAINAFHQLATVLVMATIIGLFG